MKPMTFKKFGGKPFAVELNKKEQKILDEEINKQLLEADAKFTNDMDACVLWVLHTHLGFGYRRLRRFWNAFKAEHKRLREHYEMPEDSAWLALYKLKEMGVDVEAWNAEKED